jgi:hypothetical protein
MQERLVFVISPPRAGSTLLQHMLGAHSQIFTYPEPHLITPLAFLGYYDLVDKAPYDHIHAAEAIRHFVAGLPHGEADYLDAVRAYADTLYGRMLEPSGKRYFVDKTPGYALVLPFLTRLYPDALYIVLTRHPLSIASSYANSFFDGDWLAAHRFNPVVNRYVPAVADMLRAPPRHLLQISYEALVRDPRAELARLCSFLGLDFQEAMIDYGAHYQPAPGGRGDPINVQRQSRPVADSLDKWSGELASDPDKRALAADIVASLHPDDVALWGFVHDELLPRELGPAKRPTKPKTSAFLLQRRIMLALKKDIRQRPHGKVVERLRYYCNVLLRE